MLSETAKAFILGVIPARTVDVSTLEANRSEAKTTAASGHVDLWLNENNFVAAWLKTDGLRSVSTGSTDSGAGGSSRSSRSGSNSNSSNH